MTLKSEKFYHYEEFKKWLEEIQKTKVVKITHYCCDSDWHYIVYEVVVQQQAQQKPEDRFSTLEVI